MGNRKRTGHGGTATTERSVNNASASPEPPATLPGEHGNGSSPSPCGEAGLDAYIQRLAEAAPPLTDAQRDTLTLLLRRPPRR
jgi:hypothetical protein